MTYCNNSYRAWAAGEDDDDEITEQDLIDNIPYVIEDAFELNYYETDPANNEFVYSMMRLVLEAGSKYSWTPVFHAMRSIVDGDEITFLAELQEAAVNAAKDEVHIIVDYMLKHYREELEIKAAK
jgi:hypothetical protein